MYTIRSKGNDNRYAYVRCRGVGKYTISFTEAIDTENLFATPEQALHIIEQVDQSKSNGANKGDLEVLRIELVPESVVGLEFLKIKA